MNGNAQCEHCETYALPATSEERICDDCKDAVRSDLRRLLDSPEED